MSANPIYISSKDQVVINSPYVIFYGDTPISITWDNAAQTNYFIVNNTASTINFTSETSYYDANSVQQISLPAGVSLNIVKNDLNNWIEVTSPNTVVTTGGTNPTFSIGIASYTSLGIVKIGSTLTIGADGTLNYNGGTTGSVDWSNITGKPTFANVATTGDYNSLLNRPFIYQFTGTNSQYTRGDGTYGVIASVGISGSYNDLTNKPTIPPTVTLTAGTNITITGGPNYTINSTSSGIVSSLTTIGTSGVATLTEGVLNVPNYTAGSSIPTSIPLASTLGILTNGTDQTSALNTIFLNAAIAGVVLDFVNPGAVTVNGTLNGQGKIIRFVPGNYFTGTGTLTNFILDTGLRQKCFDIGSSGVPVLTVNPIGTTLSIISPWAFGAKSDGSDSARAFQATIDCCIRVGQGNISKMIIPSGTYKCNSPLIQTKWNGSTVGSHQISIEGETNFSESSGYGTVIDFSARRDSFGIGIQLGKGSSIKNLKLIGGFAYSFPGATAFYNMSWSTMTDGVSRDSPYSPNSAIVVDPFGTSIPADGGWPGNDAYGVALSTYYRGSGTGGSTGVTLEDIFMTNWVIGFITSPNGQTRNAELVSAWKLQFSNIKLCICSCSDQEKLNTFSHIESWGVTGCVFATAVGYGPGSPGSWWVDGVNIAGYSNTFVYNVQSGYFPCYFSNIYAESLGRFGQISSNNGTTVMNSTINFANYVTETFGYFDSQIQGQGMTFIGCQIRIYGTFKPVTINALNGPMFFRDCAFETVPFYNQEYTMGYCAFSNCVVSGTGYLLNPIDMQTISGGGFSKTYAYGNIRVKIGNALSTQRTYNIKGAAPATRMPINTTGAGYTVTTSLVGGVYQSVITCPLDELNRVFVGDVICADTTNTGVGIRLMGVVSAAGSGTFTINYIAPWVVSGTSYHLYVWLPLHNMSFTGDVTSGSNLITNVTALDGTLSDFVVSGGSGGGLFLTNSYTATDTYASKLIRLISWNSGTSTITTDKNSTVTQTKIFFTNVDAQLESPVQSVNAPYTPGLAVNTTNYTINTATFVTLPDLTGQGNRNVVLPSSPIGGQRLIIRNINADASTFNWSPTGGTIKDYANNTISTLANQTTYFLVFDGTNWDIIN